MKRKLAEKVNGYYVIDFERGFWGENREGEDVLDEMGLDPTEIPFSIATFLQDRRICWKDDNGDFASMSFDVKDDRIEFYGSYKGRKKSMRMMRDWNDDDDPVDIAHMESEAIGELCMRCVYDVLPNN